VALAKQQYNEGHNTVELAPEQAAELSRNFQTANQPKSSKVGYNRTPNSTTTKEVKTKLRKINESNSNSIQLSQMRIIEAEKLSSSLNMH
jgi:hypothetical protein